MKMFIMKITLEVDSAIVRRYLDRRILIIWKIRLDLVSKLIDFQRIIHFWIL